mmetsp:Transcript_6768/g.25577  ORF Transcript_6768/g.25577 Transcript_6768/m.25577 type:complete len:203 (+) Transcript_6768:426-1034(+)
MESALGTSLLTLFVPMFAGTNPERLARPACLMKPAAVWGYTAHTAEAPVMHVPSSKKTEVEFSASLVSTFFIVLQGRKRTSFSARYLSKIAFAGSGRGHGTGADTVMSTASRTPCLRKKSSAIKAASNGATGHLYGVAAMIIARVCFFSAATLLAAFALAVWTILCRSAFCLSTWLCEYMSTHLSKPGIDDGSPTTPGARTK